MRVIHFSSSGDFQELWLTIRGRGIGNDPYAHSARRASDFLRKPIFYRKEVKDTMINKVITRAKTALRRLKSKKGQTLVEYALILAFIAVVAISVLLALGQTVRGVFSTINSQLQLAQSSH